MTVSFSSSDPVLGILVSAIKTVWLRRKITEIMNHENGEEY